MTQSISKLSAEKPLDGAQLCCTSIPPESRSQLAEWAQEMGADHTLDLTSDVTHLLVGDTDSAKYRYVAREREDVKVLLPEYIQALRTLWMNDQPIDLNALDAQYKCPTLFGLKICITGFEDLDFRNELAKNIVKNGGEYTGDLTKDVTHLIAFTPEGKKYEYAQTWKLKIVSIKWYKDTLDRGMQLDEEKYHPTILPEHQGVGAWNRRDPARATVGKRQRGMEPAQQPNRKLRRTASAKFGSQQNDMWNDIVGQHGPPTTLSANTKLRPSKPMPSIDAAVSMEDEQHPQSEDRSRSLMQQNLLNEDRNTEAGILTRKHFHVKGFDDRRRAVLHRTLSSHGGVVHDTLTALKKEAELDADSCLMIVPFEIESHRLANFEQTCPNVTIVTEFWLEWCMTSNMFVAPENYALGLPATPIHLPAASKLVINATGFPQRQTLHISKIVHKLGAVYQENFTQNTTVLVCNSANPNRQKIQHAQAWRMPVVSEKWLWQLIKNGRVPSLEPFMLVQMAQDAPTKQAGRATRATPVEHSNGTEASPSRSLGGHQPDCCEEDSFIDVARDIQARNQGKQKSLTDDTAHKAIEANRAVGAQKDSPGSSRSVSARTVLDKQKPTPLQEASGNKISRRPSSTKKKLFQTFDGHSSDKVELRLDAVLQAETADTHAEEQHNDDWTMLEANDALAPVEQQDDEWTILNANNTPAPVVPPAVPEQKSHSTLLNEFFQVKAAAEARQRDEVAANPARPTSRTSNKKKLLGRALSNLSNSSRTSNDNNNNNRASNGQEKQALSRASSINSINTDGLGVPLSALSRIPSELQKKEQIQEQQTRPSLRGNTLLTRDSTSAVPSAANPTTSIKDMGMADVDFHAALTTLSTSQPPRPPSPTQQPQLTYADSSQAMALKARLAEKRRNRAKLGQKEGDPEPALSREESEEKRQREYKEAKMNALERVVRDDEALVGPGRRTRGRQKALSKMFERGAGEEGEGEGVGAGNIF